MVQCVVNPSMCTHFTISWKHGSNHNNVFAEKVILELNVKKHIPELVKALSLGSDLACIES